MAEEQQKTEDIAGPPEVVSWIDFLQERPPGSIVRVSGAVREHGGYRGVPVPGLFAPEIQLHCPEQTCNAYMFFTSEDGQDELSKGKWARTFLTYRCRNCGKYTKIFSLAVRLVDDKICEAYKFGELPHFGPPLPARVLRLIQPDREIFLSGRRCENQGLGIGAFTYYRRVVENQWTRLVDEIIRVGEAIGASEPQIEELESLRDEKQFSKAVKSLKAAMPAALLINGHNPLVLLHGALSQGVHNLSDEDCLALATSIRVVLIELAEKLGQALKDEKELSDAVTQLLKVQAKKGE